MRTLCPITNGVTYMKVKTQKNGAWTIFDKCGAYYNVKLYAPNGDLYDKIMCDDYRMALDYLRSFNAIAKNKF